MKARTPTIFAAAFMVGTMCAAGAFGQATFPALQARSVETQKLYQHATASMVQVNVTHSAASILNGNLKADFEKWLSNPRDQSQNRGSGGGGRGGGRDGGRGGPPPGGAMGGGRGPGGNLAGQVADFLRSEIGKANDDDKRQASLRYLLLQAENLRYAFQGDMSAILLDDKGNALLLTGLMRAAHEDAETLKVTLPGGKETAARFVGANVWAGYTIIRLANYEGVKPIGWSRESLAPGQELLQIGAASGASSNVLAPGRGSVADRFAVDARDRVGAFLFDVANGNLAAVTSWSGRPGEQEAVSWPRLKREVEYIVQPAGDKLGRDIEAKQLGITLDRISNDRMNDKLRAVLGARRGVEVTGIEKNSLAEAARLREKDVVISINGRPMVEWVTQDGRGLPSLMQMLIDLSMAPGEVTVGVIRREDGKEEERTLKMNVK